MSSAGRVLVAVLGVVAATSAPAGELGEMLSGAYVDPEHLTRLEFGKYHSHYLQPWRAWLETVPAAQFLRGVGVCMPPPGKFDDELVCRMLAEHGFGCGRVEIGWAKLGYDDETELQGGDQLAAQLAAMHRHGIRPVILLNGHHGAPCPVRFFDRTVTAAAAAGDRQLTLDRVDGLRPDYSGPCNLSEYWACQGFVTAIDGLTVTLSRPLSKAIAAGTKQRFATLRYRPFSVPDSEDYQASIAGWQRYTGTVAKFAAQAMGMTGSADVGFDLEVWNELTFGSRFLSINDYYDPPLAKYDERSIWQNLVASTAAELNEHPERYAGTTLVNGFGNTIPWPASTLQPARVGGLGKHPYAGRKTYPQDERKSKALDARGEPTNWIPSYSALFPEYYATALQTETLCRDSAPIATNLYRTVHGRTARTAEQGGDCPVWITEVNLPPAEHAGITDPAAGQRLKAKAAARYFTFYLNKGVEKLTLYNASGHKDPDLDFATLSGAFLDYAAANHDWPADPEPLVSEQLKVVGRIAAAMHDGLDESLVQTRAIGVAAISDEHDHRQFDGDGTAANPPLYNREVLAILPYQRATGRFTVAYYVMSRDITIDLPPERYRLTLTGVDGSSAKIRVVDPWTGTEQALRPEAGTPASLTIEVEATDVPRLLQIDESG